MKTYQNIISKFSRKNLLVVGDIMLDRHIQGKVHRISPEAPVPVVLEDKSFYAPGGAANVSKNLSALGAKVTQIGKIGNDLEGMLLKRELKRQHVDISGVFVDKNIHTITKTRVIAQHQQIVRIDKEKIKPICDGEVDKKIISFIEKNIDHYHGIILSDYGKGMVNPELVSAIRELALKKKKVITIDPKVEHFSYYRGVTCITPNKKEAENAIRDIKIRDQAGSRLNIYVDQLDSIELVERAGKQLIKYLGLESLLITLGENGMMLFEEKGEPYWIKTKAREVFDVTGAGDTVISTFTLALTAGASKRHAAYLANTAAGVVVGRMGAVALTKEELLEALKDKS